MSEPTAAPAAPARPRPGQGKTYLGLTRTQLYIVGGVFVAAVGYILWKRHQSSTAAASSQTATNAGSDECTDENGNPVDCNSLFAQELAGLENQLASLGSQSGGGGISSGSAGGGTSGTDSGTGAASTTGTTNTSPNPPASTAATVAGAISNLQAYNVKATTATIKWNPANNASQGYAWKVTTVSGGATVSQGSTRSTTVNLTGLKASTTYNFGVQGLPGGPGDNIHFTTAKG